MVFFFPQFGLISNPSYWVIVSHAFICVWYNIMIVKPVSVQLNAKTNKFYIDTMRWATKSPHEKKRIILNFIVNINIG